MIVYLRSGGKLRDLLKPDVDQYTRKVEVEDGLTVGDILDRLGVPPAMIAFAFAGGKVRKLDYVPSDGEAVTIQSPVAGG
ncbi:MoaD/ThiS family protein [bacterium]|nr:MoaD/ThiS family protein [bacterium]